MIFISTSDMMLSYVSYVIFFIISRQKLLKSKQGNSIISLRYNIFILIPKHD